MASFSGVKRRFQLTGTWNGVAIYDDYGHHPVEIAAVLKAARAGARGRVIAVVEPHRYTRVRDLFDDFAACFKDADSVVVTPMYSAGELPIEGVDHVSLAEAIRTTGHRSVATVDSERDLGADAAALRGFRRHGRVPGRRQQHRVGLRAARLAGGRAHARGRGLVSFPDLATELAAALPDLRGRLIANQALADITWFRVGGPAQVLFTPADAADLAYFLRGIPAELPVFVIGLGSNLLVRDGGVPGVVIRMGRGFAEIKVESGHRLRAGTAVPDVKLARAAADAALSGLAFYRGIPGSIGGALRMNAGAHGRETKDVLVEAHADRPAGQHARAVAGRHEIQLSPLRRAARLDLHRGPLPGHARRYGGDPQADERGRRISRGQPADQGAHRRLHLQEPAGLQRLEADRRRGLPRAFASAAPRCPTCTATS